MVYTDYIHLVADTLKELHVFARALGLRREWFRDHPRHPHYDLTTARMANRVLKRGGLLVTSEDLVEICKNIKR